MAGPRQGATAPGSGPYVDLCAWRRPAGDRGAGRGGQGCSGAAVEDSIRVRVDTDLTVGVILSGGLDSSIVLTHVAEMHPDCVALTIGAPGSDDLLYARRLCADLGVPHEVIDRPARGHPAADVREAIRLSELTEYGDIINAVVSVPLFAPGARSSASRSC